MISQDDVRNSGEHVLSAHERIVSSFAAHASMRGQIVLTGATNDIVSADYEAGFLVHAFCAWLPKEDI